MKLSVKLFSSYDEAFRYLLRAIRVNEKLVPFLAEKTDAFCIAVENFPKKGIKNLARAAERSCVKVAFPTMLELAPEYLKVLLIGNEFDFKTLAKNLKEFPALKPLAKEIVELIVRYRRRTFKIVYNRKVLPLGLKTHVMGVLNVTPDSFSDGGEATTVKAAVEKALKMVHEGADIIDIGGESTRPGAKPVDAKEELKRVLPVLKELKKELERQKLDRVWISVDTYKAEVARATLGEGADIINDISGFTFDEKLPDVIVEYGAPVVINHIKGTPQTWRKNPPTYGDVISEILSFWDERIKLLLERGYEDPTRIVLDPGIGFGKLPEHNIEILKRFGELRSVGRPLLIGVSRKSFINEINRALLGYELNPKKRLYGSLAALAPAVMGGANIVRVHDVKATREFLVVLDSIKTYDPYYFG
jgi:dihydropteroate synthase